MSTREKLIADIERFLRITGMHATDFGIALNDRSLVTRLKQGKDIHTRTLDRARDYMRDYVPPPKKTPERAERTAAI